MKMAWITKDLKVNGANRITLEVASGMQRLGWDSRLFIDREAECVESWLPTDVPIEPVEQLFDFSPDVAVSTYFTTFPILHSLRDTLLLVQYIYTNYDRDGMTSDPRLPLINDAMRDESSQKVVVSFYLQHWLRLKGVGSHVVQPGLSPEAFFPNHGRDRLAFRVLIEGDLRPEKRVSDAYALVPHDISVWGLGQVDHRNRAQRMWILPPQHLLQEIYSSCDVMVKLVRKEGHPLTMLEAMACGVVPLCSDDGGHLDYCVDGFNCLVVQDESKVPELIKTLRDDEALRLRLSHNAIATARTFSWAQTVNRFASLIGELSRR